MINHPRVKGGIDYDVLGHGIKIATEYKWDETNKKVLPLLDISSRCKANLILNNHSSVDDVYSTIPQPSASYVALRKAVI